MAGLRRKCSSGNKYQIIGNYYYRLGWNGSSFILSTIILMLGRVIGSSSSMYHPATSLSEKEVSMGTTIIALGYKDGVIVGADTRTSASGYVSNRFANKLTFVLDPSMDHYIYPYKIQEEEEEEEEEEENDDGKGSTCCICRSGSAADTQYLADAVRSDLISRQIQLSNNNGNTVATVAHLLKQRMNDDDDDFKASLICAGYDHVRDSGVIYSILPGGTCMEEISSWAIAGSGSTYIHGFLSDALHQKKDSSLLEEGEAISLLTKALRLAMTQDGSSGGFIRIYVINRHGKRQIILPHSTTKQSPIANKDTNNRNAKLFAPPIRYPHKQ